MAPALRVKLDGLAAHLERLDKVIVAFSGGADSALLAWAAHDVLGAPGAMAVTAVSPSLATAEQDGCRELVDRWGLEWRVVHTTEMDSAAYRANDTDRCYWCKDALMDAVAPLAASSGAVVALGVNVDDLGDHRPGQRAAAERGAVFPLVDAGFTKEEVRTVSRALGLSTWDKPAAPCLASRLPYGTPVTLGRLRSVERAEAALRSLGFRDLRVRHHGELARVELPFSDIEVALGRREEVASAVRAAGYRFVAVDLDGLRSGSLNPPGLAPDA